MSKSNLAKFASSVRLWTGKHTPEILTGIGIAGMITTTVLAVRATPKALLLIEEKKAEDGTDEVKAIDVVKTCWKCYIPAAVTGVTSIGCLIGASSVSARRTAALAAAYQLSETALTEYKDKVVKVIGEKKEEAVRDEIAKDRAEKAIVTDKRDVILTGKGHTLCLDYYTGNLFESDIDAIKKAVNELNRRMNIDMYVSLNDLYDELGLDHTGAGDDLGWNLDNGLIDVEFSAQLVGDRPCVVLTYTVSPRYGYSQFI